MYPTWLSNLVLGELHMCIDYTSLKKGCPKDSFALPRIDQIVDSILGYEYLYLMDAYPGYHKIRMREKDVPHISFITPFGMFCYKTMPFGLNNAVAHTRALCRRHSAPKSARIWKYTSTIWSSRQRGRRT